MSIGGCLFTFGLIEAAIFAGFYHLFTAHFPDHMDYGIWDLIAG
jgi:hypothetical protein